jgi:hypothetical protein
MTMSNSKVSRLLLAALLLGAGVAQAAPSSAVEVPGAWYADQIVVTDARGTTQPFPTAAYEHGPTVAQTAETTRIRPSFAGTTAPFPASPNESGSVL